MLLLAPVTVIVKFTETHQTIIMHVYSSKMNTTLFQSKNKNACNFTVIFINLSAFLDELFHSLQCYCVDATFPLNQARYAITAAIIKSWVFPSQNQEKHNNVGYILRFSRFTF